MSVIRIASRYAKSLLDLAKERGELEIVHKDILDFKQDAMMLGLKCVFFINVFRVNGCFLH